MELNLEEISTFGPKSWVLLFYLEYHQTSYQGPFERKTNWEDIQVFDQSHRLTPNKMQIFRDS